jgi:CBS domain-containing protein
MRFPRQVGSLFVARRSGACMKAADIMVTQVVTLRPEQTVYEAAELMVDHRISGVPVVREDRTPVGIITESDLMRRPEAGTQRRHSAGLPILTGPEQLARQYIKENAYRVQDVMTRDVITGTPETDLADVADLLEHNRIKRVPIVAAGKVVGIVSRADLVRALVTIHKRLSAEIPASDETLREKIIERLRDQPWAAQDPIDVKVHDGKVELSGTVDYVAQRKALRAAVESVSGVRAIEDHIVVRPIVIGA